MRTTDRTHRSSIFPVLVSSIEREILSTLSRGEVVRRLVLKEIATRQLAYQEVTTKACVTRGDA